MTLEQLKELKEKMRQTQCNVNHNCMFCSHLDFCKAFRDFYYRLIEEIEERIEI